MEFEPIAAVILAAGESRRMGQPKLLLPWGKTTILGQVAATLAQAGIAEILVVTGGARQPVEELVSELAKELPVRTTHNPDYRNGGMISSIQAGLKALGSQVQAALVALGDQPQMKVKTVQQLCKAYFETGSPLVIPSFKNQRGHPWLAGRPLWEAILAQPPSVTPRAFLNEHAEQVEYIPGDESILQDLDTPEDYDRARP